MWYNSSIDIFIGLINCGLENKNEKIGSLLL